MRRVRLFRSKSHMQLPAVRLGPLAVYRRAVPRGGRAGGAGGVRAPPAAETIRGFPCRMNACRALGCSSWPLLPWAAFSPVLAQGIDDGPSGFLKPAPAACRRTPGAARTLAGQAADGGSARGTAQPGAARPAVPRHGERADAALVRRQRAALRCSPRKVDRLAAMGEGENLNEMVRGAGGYSDPAIAAVHGERADAGGRARKAACAMVARNSQLPQSVRRACRGGLPHGTGRR